MACFLVGGYGASLCHTVFARLSLALLVGCLNRGAVVDSSLLGHFLVRWYTPWVSEGFRYLWLLIDKDHVLLCGAAVRTGLRHVARRSRVVLVFPC